jgi:hypothetical protein
MERRSAQRTDALSHIDSGGSGSDGFRIDHGWHGILLLIGNLMGSVKK